MNAKIQPNSVPAGVEKNEKHDKAAQPAYEPPRITRKRSLSRTTLFTGGDGTGLIG